MIYIKRVVVILTLKAVHEKAALNIVILLAQTEGFWFLLNSQSIPEHVIIIYAAVYASLGTFRYETS